MAESCRERKYCQREGVFKKEVTYSTLSQRPLLRGASVRDLEGSPSKRTNSLLIKKGEVRDPSPTSFLPGN